MVPTDEATQRTARLNSCSAGVPYHERGGCDAPCRVSDITVFIESPCAQATKHGDSINSISASITLAMVMRARGLPASEAPLIQSIAGIALPRRLRPQYFAARTGVKVNLSRHHEQRTRSTRPAHPEASNSCADAAICSIVGKHRLHDAGNIQAAPTKARRHDMIIADTIT
eukprot:COSAG01_NODE_778_length_13681_cov_15.265130_13_plen_171_part_00